MSRKQRQCVDCQEALTECVCHAAPAWGIATWDDPETLDPHDHGDDFYFEDGSLVLDIADNSSRAIRRQLRAQQEDY